MRMHKTNNTMTGPDSRFMMPEHVAYLHEHKRNSLRKSRPELDPQETEYIAQIIANSHRERTPVNLRMYDEWDEPRVIGVVERVDSREARFMVDGEWFRVVDVLSAD